MKISIITVCFNSVETIEKTIESVKSQDYDDIEYIIVDGNSSDGTINIIKKYESNVIDKWISESDKGLYDAMNKGLEMATGDFVGVLNSDDYFYGNSTISKVVEFLKNHSDIDAITGDVMYEKNGKIIRKYSSKKWKPDLLKIGFMPPHLSIFIRRTMFDKYGNYTLGYKIASDYELIIRFFLKNKIKYKYSDIITTIMSVGGLSSSGWSSYKTITKEIDKAFKTNNIAYSPFKVKFRFVWKLLDYIREK